MRDYWGRPIYPQRPRRPGVRREEPDPRAAAGYPPAGAADQPPGAGSRPAAPPPAQPAPDTGAGAGRSDQSARVIEGLTADNAELRRQLDELRTQLDDVRRESDERLGQAQRLRADHVNYKRRVEEERAEERQRASAMLIIKLLPLLDDFERAMDSAGPDLAGLTWVQGIGQIGRKLRQSLESEGLTRIDALGQPFDPTQHEAVLREETDDDHVGEVLGVLQPGYRLQDRVVRPAAVKVGVPRSAVRERGD